MFKKYSLQVVKSSCRCLLEPPIRNTGTVCPIKRWNPEQHSAKSHGIILQNRGYLMNKSCSQNIRCSSSTSSGFNVSPPDKLYRAIDIYLKAHDDAVLNSYIEFATQAAAELDITLSNVLAPKKVTDRFTVLRSVHIHKKHRVQYEAFTYKRVIQLKQITECTSDVYLSYLQINIPAGVAMHVHKWEITPLLKSINENIALKCNEMNTREKQLKETFTYPITTEDDYEETYTTKSYIIGATM